ncbi:CpsD/CapB family tyrosine-protein kinase [Paenibacillus endoradicis]|uniref:CpsD/CapB family tyrosine-protein kinase n=1 Tax=Paenibacillus endoradicis TaxID=2972487 RepID=UPI002159A8C5|nr:CpsD/CapB family tyrosine-protein kinase [Paenibacillus endoradicis]MCR8660652.1 CpsD/CapB family tyrosine-protein kinase [Paenibacillus endoradicis]
MSQSTNNAKRTIISLSNPKSPISESYRTLRTNISFTAVDNELKVIMVTSASPGEGKSTTAANIAVTYAQSNYNVIVMELDLRKPTVHKTFNVTNRAGITHVLTNQASLEEVIRSTDIPNIDVISSGPIPPNPSELLGSNQLVKVINGLKQIYDIIIIDTPPLLAVTDAQLVASICDGVILVVDSGQVKRSAAIDAKQKLDRVNAKILGVVLNNVKKKKNDDYYYYYYGEKED